MTNAILSTELAEEFRSKLRSIVTDQSLRYSEDRYELQQTVNGTLGWCAGKLIYFRPLRERIYDQQIMLSLKLCKVDMDSLEGLRWVDPWMRDEITRAVEECIHYAFQMFRCISNTINFSLSFLLDL